MKGRPSSLKEWSPMGKTRSALLNAPVGRHPGQTPAHSSTAKGRACTPKCLPSPKRFVQAGVSVRSHGLLLPG